MNIAKELLKIAQSLDEQGVPDLADKLDQMALKVIATEEEDQDVAQIHGMVKVLDNYLLRINEPNLTFQERDKRVKGFHNLLKNLLAHPKAKEVIGEQKYRGYMNIGFDIGSIIREKPIASVIQETIYGSPPKKNKA